MREWSGDTLTGLTSHAADIRNAKRVQEVVRETRPEWIVLAAAYTDVDGCENNPDLAFAVNRDGAVNVATAAKEVGARLIFLSSDYVFDGKKSTPYETGDARNPQSVYGRSKAEAEIRLLELLPDCCIVRTSWLFGLGGKCFPDTILKLAAAALHLTWLMTSAVLQPTREIWRKQSATCAGRMRKGFCTQPISATAPGLSLHRKLFVVRGSTLRCGR